ncbi:MAG: NFACT RNA binding domain-containing protein [Humidesulfovibrio sp.]|nr:NFACT RNA binding domain-containing protein [Humidesulfovibrio sp.]
MEANFFRFLAGELATALTGQRVEKVHGPADGVLILTLYGQGRKSNLVFRPVKQAGLLFVTDERPQNPLAAPARVMWLRKRLTGRRLLSCRADWPNLRLAFSLSPRDVPDAGQWLVLDLREDLTLTEDFPLQPEPGWPDLPRLLDGVDVWREFPQATPPLRKHLAALAQTNPDQAERLLARLAAGQSDGFYLPQSGPPQAWPPLPDARESTRYESAREAAQAYGERALFAHLGQLEAREDLDQAATARKRLTRQLALLDKDETRHRALAELAIPAEALQIALSSMNSTPQVQSITLDHPVHGPQQVPLAPRLSPVENMAQLFRQAAKGRRGLEHVARRRTQLLAGIGPEILPARSAGSPAKAAPPAPVALPKRYQGLAVAMFRTSDGFLVLRGKSSQANHDMLSRAASPHDYWLHAAGGPSAHVILRRDYPDQPVPEQSLVEAAILCALKSYRKDDAKAEVLLARVKDVRKVKGAAIGSVAVDEVERMLLVGLDPELEKRLTV